MSKKNKNSISVTFVSEVELIQDKAQVKAGYKDLVKQITSFAESVAADPNIIISHSTINMAGETPSLKDPASPKMAELQTINTRIGQGKTAVTKPDYKSKFEPKLKKEETEVEEEKEPEVDPDEVPRVKAYWTPPTKTTPVVDGQVAATPVTVVALDPGLKGKMEVTIFSKLKKTEKSAAIVGFFLNNMGKELTVSDIAEGSKIENKAVSMWLGTTAKEIKAIKNVSRGKYIFDSEKVRI